MVEGCTYSTFLLVDALVVVLVDECLIWYLCRYLFMSLLQLVCVPVEKHF